MKQRFSTKKDWQKLVQTHQEKQLERFGNKSDNVEIAKINQTFSVKLLAHYSSCLHCYIIFWKCGACCHISHFAYHLRCYIILDHILTSYDKCYVYVNFKQTNQSCWSSKSNQSINAEWRTCDISRKTLVLW